MPHMMAINQTSYQEIDAYLSLIGESLQEWEVNALKSLDTTYVKLLLELSKNGHS